MTYPFSIFSKRKRRALKQANQAALSSHLRRLLYETSYRKQVTSSNESGVGNDENHEIILSLTSHGARVDSAYLTIESLMEQSLKADRIILNLNSEAFTEKNLPATLKRQMARGLEVHFCQDMGPYTKFYATLERNPNSLIITVDDDIMFPVDLVDQLFRAYVEQPTVIPCLRSHLMTFSTEDGAIKPYKQWQWGHDKLEPSLRIFPTGVGGVLYFPGCFDERVLDASSFKSLAPNADDVWLKCMSLLKGTACRQITNQSSYSERFLQVEGSQRTALKRKNKNKKSGNDSSIDQVFSAYSAHDLLS